MYAMYVIFLNNNKHNVCISILFNFKELIVIIYIILLRLLEKMQFKWKPWAVSSFLSHCFAHHSSLHLLSTFSILFYILLNK